MQKITVLATNLLPTTQRNASWIKDVVHYFKNSSANSSFGKVTSNGQVFTTASNEELYRQE
jgi:hypothetical protein